MESNENNYQVLKDYLIEQGHGLEEIQLIIARVEDCQDMSQHDSIMDSIGTGGMGTSRISFEKRWLDNSLPVHFRLMLSRISLQILPANSFPIRSCEIAGPRNAASWVLRVS